MRLAEAWQRLVKRRWTTPAREHAAKMRLEAMGMKRAKVRSGTVDALFQGAAHIDRLADVIDELAEPEESKP